MKNQNFKTKNYGKFRPAVLISFFLGLFFVLGANLYNIQINQGDSYFKQAFAQFKFSKNSLTKRGEIYFTDKNGNLSPAAINKPYKYIYAVPSEISDVKETSEIISDTLSLDKDKIQSKLLKKNDLYEEIVFKVSDYDGEKVKNLNLPGIYVDSRDARYYPYEKLASHVLGFVGPSGEDDEIKGRYGIESLFNDDLSGSDKVEGDNVLLPGNSGEDIILNIDRNIQSKIEEILERVVVTKKATAGSIIIQEPKTGKILALANYPNFDPNSYNKYPLASFLNPSLQLLYEPGSVMKPITMSAGIEEKKITPESTFFDKGFLLLNKKKITNFNQTAYGKVSMTDVIGHSINTGAAYVASLLGKDLFKKYITDFGFNEKTKISLPGEVRGSLKSLDGDNVPEINVATASFGQGVAVTPIEMISAFSAIANGGNIMRPLIFKSEKPEIIRHVVSKETTEEVRDMMIRAVLNGKYAEIPKYNVAGKTGTAQISKLKSSGYEENAYIHTFIGFAPALDPRFTVLVKIDRPEIGPLAGVTVVPAFKDVMTFLLEYFNVPPDNLSDIKK